MSQTIPLSFACISSKIHTLWANRRVQGIFIFILLQTSVFVALWPIFFNESDGISHPRRVQRVLSIKYVVTFVNGKEEWHLWL